MTLHRCTTCNKTFTALDFEHNHPCVDEADKLSMGELERRIKAKERQGKTEDATCFECGHTQAAPSPCGKCGGSCETQTTTHPRKQTNG